MATPFEPTDLYVAPGGNDSWSGHLPEPNAAQTDGPLGSLQQAQQRLRELRLCDRPVPATVWIRGGTYRLSEPLTFTPTDSGPVAFRAYPGETPVMDGGTPITNWSETEVNGVPCWVADVSTLIERARPFASLFVDGKRRPQARLPKQGFYEVDFPNGAPETAELFAGEFGFHAKPGEFKAWRNLNDIEVVLLHLWAEDHLPVSGFNPETNRVTSTRKSIFTIKEGDCRYYINNVFEALTEPGEWYLDKAEGRLYYVPEDGETIDSTTVVAATVLQWLRLLGSPEAGDWVEHITFEGLTFQHADWVFPKGWGKRFDPYRPPEAWPHRDSFAQFTEGNRLSGTIEYGNTPQGSHFVPGAIRMVGARNCAIRNCTVRNAGFYGIEIAEGCRDVRIEGNDIFDLGGGGIMIDGGTYPSPESTYTSRIFVTDNRVHAVGRIFHSACGVLVCHAFQNRICHNEIFDTFYTGISVGWVWSRERHVTRENLVEKNHIHHIGAEMLSDMGGIYLLGIQPGTILRGNLIHDVAGYHYGGWGIYPDGFTANVVIEDNIVYNTKTESVHNNSGNCENLYRNNIFAFGKKGFCDLTRPIDHFPAGYEDRSMRSFGNIVVVKNAPLYNLQFFLQNGIPETQNVIDADFNLYWDMARERPIGARENWTDDCDVDFDQWMAWGCDRHGIIADPGFADPENGDFTLPEDSPAFRIGFKPIDMRDVGPRR